MSRKTLTVFLCGGKDCRRAWRRVCDGSPAKWLKREVDAAGLPYKLKIIETACMDRCEGAACLCCVAGNHAEFLTEIRCSHDSDSILAVLRCGAELSPPFYADKNLGE